MNELLPAGGDVFQEVRSPEQVALHLPIAGPGSRVLAYSIDYAAILLLEAGLFVVLILTTPLVRRLVGVLGPYFEGLGGGDAQPEAVQSAILIAAAVFILSQLLVETVYFFVFEILNDGVSLGKQAIGLRVVGADGAPITAQASLVRNLLRVVDVLPGSYLVGLVSMVVSNRSQRLGDLAAGTIVVRLDRPVSALPIAEPTDPEPVFRFSHAQLSNLGPTEKTLIRQTLRRVEMLEPNEAERVLGHTVQALCHRMNASAVPASERAAFLRALLHAIDAR